MMLFRAMACLLCLMIMFYTIACYREAKSCKDFNSLFKLHIERNNNKSSAEEVLVLLLDCTKDAKRLDIDV